MENNIHKNLSFGQNLSLHCVQSKRKFADLFVSQKIHEEYITYHDRFAINGDEQCEGAAESRAFGGAKAGYSDESIAAEGKKLFNKRIAISEKKRILFLLAHAATPKGYQVLQEYLEKGDPALREWSILASKECSLGLQSDLFDNDAVTVLTGLGEKGAKFRYFFMFHSADNSNFSTQEKQTVTEAIKAASRKYDAEMEELTLRRNCVSLTVLIPFEVAVGDFIDRVITFCNRKQALLCPDYYVTNVKKPTKKEILAHLASHGQS